MWDVEYSSQPIMLSLRILYSMAIPREAEHSLHFSLSGDYESSRPTHLYLLLTHVVSSADRWGDMSWIASGDSGGRRNSVAATAVSQVFYEKVTKGGMTQHVQSSLGCFLKLAFLGSLSPPPIRIFLLLHICWGIYFLLSLFQLNSWGMRGKEGGRDSTI